MTDRTLPGWMTKKQKPEEFAQEQSGFYKKNILEDDLPYLEFSGTVIYSQEKNDCSFLSEDFRSSLAPGTAVGFDLEWPPSFTKGKKKKVAMVQLCASEDKCYLFHLSSMSGFPSSLKMFLEDETIKKVGVGIEGDMWKLLSDFDIKLKNFVELSDLANEKLRCMEKWSLDGLVKHLFKRRLFKDNDVRCSQWDDFELTEDQKKYAATDAYAGLIIHQKLERVTPGWINSQTDLKKELSRMASEIEELAACIPERLNCTNRAEMLLEDMSQKLSSLRDLLLRNSDTAGTAVEEPASNTGKDQTHVLSDKKTNTTDDTTVLRQGSPGDKDHGHSTTDLVNGSGPVDDVSKPVDCQSAQRDCIMSLDISEYDLQMFERQARQEELDERPPLEFQEKTAMDTSADLSYEVESDEELENEMLQCVEEVESLNRDGKPHHDDQKEDEDDDIEEEEEEGFDPTLPEPKPEQIKCLKMYFGHHSFKPVQWKVIHSVLKERRDNLVVMATGYGKSLCFQFPPVYCVSISVVISPLIALMEDQVLQLQLIRKGTSQQHLKMSNIPACFLGSAQTKNVFADLKKGAFRVVYMTPEFCSGNISLLEELNSSIGLSLIAVDEAHCISQWGHDFRDAYRSLWKLKKSLPLVPIVALTATASPSIRKDIVKSLNLVDPLVTCTSFDRPNLYMDVNRKSGDIFQDLKHFLVKKTGGDYEFEGSAIVYCPTKKEAERVTATLSKLGILCGVYHAGLGLKQRRETQHQFMRDEIQCVVATVAFGMGINKPDIRKVIHYGAPKEMESYYQEIGRAGRDGLPSACHVLWMPGDMALNRFLLNQIKSDRFRGYKMEMMGKMEKYLNSTKCRRKLILFHFEDKQLRKVTSGILGTSKCCDNCKSGPIFSPSREDPEQGLQDFGTCAYQLMKSVCAMEERFGITAPILFLRGSNSQRVPDKYRRHSLFGAGKSVSEAWWKALGRELIMEKYLKECTGHSKFATLCKLTPKGRTWLCKAEDERQRSLLLQPNRDLCPRIIAPWRSHDPTPTVPTQGNYSTVSTQKPNPSSGIQKADTSSSRPVAGSSHATVAKPQPPAVSPRELELQAELYAKLVAERQKLASLKDIPPAILATNKILLDMAKIRPCTVDSLKQVDGVSEAKSTMLAPLLQTITKFCETHRLQVNVSSTTASTCCPVETQLLRMAMPLPDSVSITYRLFQKEWKSMRQVSDARSLPLAVVESHLLQAQSADHPLDTERAGLSAPILNIITRIITSPPINSDLKDLKAIRALVPEDISAFLIRLTVTKLQKEGIPKQQQKEGAPKLPPSGPTVQHKITWIEPEVRVTSLSQDKPVKTVKTDRPPAPPTSSVNPDPDSIDMSEDELFSEIPMPEDVGFQHSVMQCNSQPFTASKTVPQSSGMELASWNQDELDKDTQDLFGDSPVKNVSQPSKRKLPDWAEVPKDSVPAALSKKTKKKKGLFT